MPAVVIGTLGVVFGDIGTSPIYTFRECLKSVDDCAYRPPRVRLQALCSPERPNKCSEKRLRRKLSGTSGSNPLSSSGESANPRSLSRQDALPGIVYLAAV
jgi:hypothetical protein